MKWIWFAWRNIRRNRRRTAITCAIIAVGTAALIIATGFVLATFQGLRELTIRTEFGHIQVAAPDYFDGSEHRVMEHGLRQEDAKRVSDLGLASLMVRFSMPRIYFDGLLSSKDRTIAIVGQGVEPQQEAKLSSLFLSVEQGQYFEEATDSSVPEILVASGVAKALGLSPGDEVTLLATTESGALNAIDLRIKGIYSTGIPESDKRAILVTVGSAQQLLSTDKISRMVVVLKDTRDTDAMASQLRQSLPGLDVRKWSDLAVFYHRVVDLYRIIFSVMGAIVVAVVLLSSMNSMLLNIMERVREVGTLRSFGIPKLAISRNFLYEGVMLGLIGSAVGLLLGGITAVAISLSGIQMPPPPGRNVSYPLSILINVDMCLAVILVMTAASALAAWIPARRSARMKIIDALSHV